MPAQSASPLLPESVTPSAIKNPAAARRASPAPPVHDRKPATSQRSCSGNCPRRGAAMVRPPGLEADRAGAKTGTRESCCSTMCRSGPKPSRSRNPAGTERSLRPETLNATIGASTNARLVPCLAAGRRMGSPRSLGHMAPAFVADPSPPGSGKTPRKLRKAPPLDRDPCLLERWSSRYGLAVARRRVCTSCPATGRAIPPVPLSRSGYGRSPEDGRYWNPLMVSPPGVPLVWWHWR